MSSAPVHDATLRLELPIVGIDVEVAVARLWAAGALGVWEQPEVLVAWFVQRPDTDDPLLEGGSWSWEDDRDWQAEWKASIGPIRAGRTVVVPSWLAGDHRPTEDELTVVLDPGRAFGSGHHATTLLCLETLDELDLGGGLDRRRVADIGCGSGILAIAAAARGADVQAVDIDRAAVQVTRENAERNGVHLDVRHGGVEVVDGPVEVVVANLITDVVAELAGDLVAATADRLIVSGITEERSEVALGPLRETGARIDEVRTRDGWVLVVASPPDARTETFGSSATS